MLTSCDVSSLVADRLCYQEITNGCVSRFLLVPLNIDAILHESTIHRKRVRLNKMADELELGGVYSTTVEQIKEQDGDQSALGVEASMWIIHADCPL